MLSSVLCHTPTMTDCLSSQPWNRAHDTQTTHNSREALTGRICSSAMMHRACQKTAVVRTGNVWCTHQPNERAKNIRMTPRKPVRVTPWGSQTKNRYEKETFNPSKATERTNTSLELSLSPTRTQRALVAQVIIKTETRRAKLTFTSFPTPRLSLSLFSVSHVKLLSQTYRPICWNNNSIKRNDS